MADENQTSALFRRHEQLKRWHESDTHKCLDVPSSKPKRVKFQDGCIFLAACSSGDREEVKKLLDRGADINTANIDGLTALHQACIDDNLDMVEFLVANNADVDVCDNEGWTPLHATASCGFTEIARYLLRNNANVAAVNNDGDLPYDICEEDEMEKLLQESMDEQGVDADAARREEEEQMLADANQWLNNKHVKEQAHPKTGATALHVASAKGYIKVINILLQAGVDINAKDNDGWSPLHAAAHWGQEESCKILAENMCDMEAKNLAGQTAFDVADTETIKLLEELKLKQASLKDQQKDLQKDIIQTKLPSSRRSRNDPARSSVTRMSVEQKHNVMKIVEPEVPERIALDPKIIQEKEEEKLKSSSSSASEEETSESETEKKNEINKQTSDLNKPRDRDKPPIMTMVEIKEIKSDTPVINDSKDLPENIKNLVGKDGKLTNETEVIGDGLDKDKIVKKKNKSDNEKEQEEREKEKLKNEMEIIKEEKTEEKMDENENKENKENVKKDKDLKEKEIETSKEIILIKDSLKEKENLKDKEKENVDGKEKNKQKIENVPPKKDKEPIKLERTISAPPSTPEVPTTVIPKISINAKTLRDGDIEIPSWRTGLRKTGSTSTVLDKINEDDRNLPRSASSPRLAEENKKNEQNDKPLPRRPYLGSSSFSAADHNNSSISERSSVTNRISRFGGTQQSQGLSNPYRYASSSNPSSNYHSSYVPYYKLQQMKNETKEKERVEREKKEKDEKEKDKNPVTTVSSRVEFPPSTISSRVSAAPSLPVTSATTTTGSTVSTTSTTPTTITTPTSSFVHFRKSYEPPKRDEETEMLRKKRAKRARETRRSTQGVTLDEVKQASEELRKSESLPDKLKDAADEQTKTSTQEKSSVDKSETVVDGNISGVKDRLSGTSDSGLSRTATTDISSSVSNWRRKREEREEERQKTEENSRKDDDLRGSFRRSRDLRDLSSSTPSSSFYSTNTDSSTYIPRSQRTDRTERNALSVHEPGNASLSNNVNLTRSTSLRTPRIRNDEIEDTSIDFRRDRDKDREKDKGTKEADKTEKDEKRPESSAIRTRRMRRERRSTGIANYTAENDEDKDKENKDEEKKDDKTESDDKSSSSRFERYGSASDVPSHLGERTRPSSYTEYSRSTPSLEKDYKKLYEEEKIEKERLKRDLDNCKKELREAKAELDRQMKRSDASRVSETNDKRERRALERKLSELEEEIKKMDQLKEDNRRLREENGALIRVISKLSK